MINSLPTAFYHWRCVEVETAVKSNNNWAVYVSGKSKCIILLNLEM